jgi:ABC-2 type transport system permease protein
MRATSIIYRRELGSYVRSPFGWVVAVIYLLAVGILLQAYALKGDPLSAIVLERFMWASSGAVMIIAVILSFRLIAEERQNHTMVLVNTSPVRDSEIILGKFFAAATFLAGILILSLYIPLLIKVEGKVSLAQILSGYLGLWLLGCACLAIGIFSSSLTRMQLVAALIATVITFVMVVLFQLAGKLDWPMKEVGEQVDLWWIHFQNGFMKGIVNLKDIVAYVAATYFFLLLAIKTLEAKRWQ